MSVIERFYGRRMERWEERLCFRATNRVVRPFEWGTEWAAHWPISEVVSGREADPEGFLRRLNQAAIADSSTFFDYLTPTDHRLKGNLLRFTSAVVTPYPENNVVHGQWFPAKSKRKRSSFCLTGTPRHRRTTRSARGCRKFGLSALRLSLPYHDYRMPAELKRADYAVSSNVGPHDRRHPAGRDRHSQLRRTGWSARAPNASPSSVPASDPAMRSWRARTTPVLS